MKDIIEIATQISNPLALGGLAAALFFFVIRTILKAGIISGISGRSSALIVRRMVDWFFVVTLSATVLGILTHLVIVLVTHDAADGNISGNSNQQISEEYKKLLFLSAHELRVSRDFFQDISAYTHGKANFAPVGKPALENTINVLGLYHDRILKDSYGEEKYIYNLALRLNGAITEFNKLHTRQEFLAWNESYEMTVDDLHFASGFLQWYIAYQAEEVLSDQELMSLGWNVLSNKLITSIPANELNMRYFVFDGAPIIEYVVYLGLID